MSYYWHRRPAISAQHDLYFLPTIPQLMNEPSSGLKIEFPLVAVNAWHGHVVVVVYLIWPSLPHIARLEILVILRAKSSQPLRDCWAIRTLHSSHKASFMAQKNKTNICHKQRNWIKIKDFSARTTSSEGLDGRCGVVTQKTTTINNIPLRS